MHHVPDIHFSICRSIEESFNSNHFIQIRRDIEQKRCYEYEVDSKVRLGSIRQTRDSRRLTETDGC